MERSSGYFVQFNDDDDRLSISMGKKKFFVTKRGIVDLRIYFFSSVHLSREVSEHRKGPFE